VFSANCLLIGWLLLFSLLLLSQRPSLLMQELSTAQSTLLLGPCLVDLLPPTSLRPIEHGMRFHRFVPSFPKPVTNETYKRN